MTVIPLLTRECQQSIIFGPKYMDFKELPPHNCLIKDSHILLNMLTQMIIPCTKQRSEMLYIDLWMIACIMLEEQINLPYIIFK